MREIFRRERMRAHELRRSYKATVLALANAVEARDAYTDGHAQRVAAYGLRIAHAAGIDVDPQVEFGFLLHDIGKLAVPDAILFKPGPLTEEEWALMRTHPETGSEILRHIDFLDDAMDVVRHHHERWDGAGYPDGLAGEEIPRAGARLRARRHARRDHLRPALPPGRALGGGAPGDRATRAPSSTRRSWTPTRAYPTSASPTSATPSPDSDPLIASSSQGRAASQGRRTARRSRRARGVPAIVFLDYDMPRLTGSRRAGGCARTRRRRARRS